jgi:squamous cell carcinoma antigen recognized by T-cells 3
MADDEIMHDDIDDMSSASSDDSDSDYQGVEVSEADMNLIIQLEAKLEENPAVYDTYVQFIDVLRRCKMTERLREVRRAMHERFPLSESLWLDWITDELESISGEEDIPKIEILLDIAQDDYLSIALLLQRLE